MKLCALMWVAVLASTAFAEMKPAAILLASKEAMSGKAWKVDALVQGQQGFRVQGIIQERDYDLTIQSARGLSREIVIGDKGWSTVDVGKTWSPLKTIDRRYFSLTYAPIHFFPGEKIPPFEEVEQVLENGEPLVHLRFIAPEKVRYEGDRPNQWIALRQGLPGAIRRYSGPLAFQNDYVTAQVNYRPIPEPRPIQPPPGNPAAVPEMDAAERALRTALLKMEDGLWEVKATVQGKRSAKVHGFLSGRDFDLTVEPADGSTTTHEIAVGGLAWLSTDHGKTWKKVGAEDRLMYHWVHTPILGLGIAPRFEVIGKEIRNDGMLLLHLCLQVAEPPKSEKDRPHYWLALDRGEMAVSVQHFEGPLVSGLSGQQKQILHLEADYARAEGGAGIKPPVMPITAAPAEPVKKASPPKKKP